MFTDAETLVNGREIKLVNLADVASAATGTSARGVACDRFAVQGDQQISLGCDRATPPSGITAHDFTFEMESGRMPVYASRQESRKTSGDLPCVGRTGVADRNLKALVQHTHSLAPS